MSDSPQILVPLRPCTKCGGIEISPGQAWCRPCLRAYQRERRYLTRTTPRAATYLVCIACHVNPPAFRYRRCTECLAALRDFRQSFHVFDEGSLCGCKLCRGYRRLFSGDTRRSEIDNTE